MSIMMLPLLNVKMPSRRIGRKPGRLGFGVSFWGQGTNPDKQAAVHADCGLARSIQLEFPCAFYQLRARANPAQEFPVSLPALS
jgi:hypothetical protein